MDKKLTIENIENAIRLLNNAIYRMDYTGKYSNHVYQARFEQFIQSTKDTIIILKEIKDSL